MVEVSLLFMLVAVSSSAVHACFLRQINVQHLSSFCGKLQSFRLAVHDSLLCTFSSSNTCRLLRFTSDDCVPAFDECSPIKLASVSEILCN